MNTVLIGKTGRFGSDCIDTSCIGVMMRVEMIGPMEVDLVIMSCWA